ncbi:MAG TPA: flagellar biosynthesis anti-sigma factor FlgM [Steroidobacteraceae bacterium]
MANRIKGLDGGSIGSGSSGPIEKIRVSNAVNPSGAESSSAAPTDSVYITQSARSLAALALAVTDAPEIDTGRVAAVQQAIDSGQYTVSPERIAARLLQLEQDLGSAAQ